MWTSVPPWFSWRGDVHVIGHGGHDGHAEAEPFAVSVGQHPASPVGDHNPQSTTMFEFGNHGDLPSEIAVAVKHGVGGGLRDGQLDCFELLVKKPAALCKLADGSADLAQPPPVCRGRTSRAGRPQESPRCDRESLVKAAELEQSQHLAARVLDRQ